MKEINSLTNGKVVFWSKLKQKKYQDELFIIEGEHLILEALNSGYLKEIITTGNKIYSKDIPHYLITNEIMKKLSDLESLPNVMGVCYKLKENSLTSKVLILDNIQDPGNLGTLIRSALAFNFKTVVIGSNTVSIYNSKVLRATEGMIFKLNIINKNTLEMIDILKSKNYLIVGTDVNNGVDIKDIKTENMALVLGNEGKGLGENVLKLCAKKVNIKMTKDCESLNVGIAGSILMYEVYDE